MIKVITSVNEGHFEQYVNSFIKGHEDNIVKITYSVRVNEFVAFIEVDDHLGTGSESWGTYSESGAAKVESFEEYKTYKGVRILEQFHLSKYVFEAPEWFKPMEGKAKVGAVYALLESGDIVCISL